MRRSITLSVCLFCLATLVVGCSKSGTPTNRVEGKILWNDQPVAGAVVNFVPVSDGAGNMAVGMTDEKGNYVLTMPAEEFGTGALVGSYKVTVTKIASGAVGRPSITTQLPGVYAETQSTPLKAEVVTGKNKFDFTLEGTSPPPPVVKVPPSGPPQSR